MKYDSFDDYMCFILGASIASGRTFWVGDAETNKHVNSDINSSISVDGVVSLKISKE